MPSRPNSLACRAPQNQSLECCKRTGQLLESTAILSLAKKKIKRLPCLSLDVQVIGHLHDDVIAIPFIFINLVISVKFK